MTSSPALGNSSNRSLDERAILKALANRFPGVRGVRRAPFNGETSYRVEILAAQLAGGGERKVFLKDFGESRLPKRDVKSRREREVGVYRDLLSTVDLQTAEYYGCLWNDAGDRHCLFLEYVGGVPLRDCHFDDWVRAIGWLGRLDSAFAPMVETVAASPFLIVQNEEFFASTAERARQAVAEFSVEWSGRLDAALRRYDEIIAFITCQPQTLVHGSYRPQNIMVDRASGRTRVFGIDWELAAVGPRYYDFAFLADGFDPERLQVLWDAYDAEAAAEVAAAIPTGDRNRLVRCIRMHKVMKSLGDSVELKFKERTVLKLVGMAEDIWREIDA